MSNSIKIKLEETIRILLSLIIDCIFLLIWILIQFALQKYIISPLELKGLDKAFLSIYRYIFGISTAIPVILNFLRDIIIILKDFWKMDNNIRSKTNGNEKKEKKITGQERGRKRPKEKDNQDIDEKTNINDP